MSVGTIPEKKELTLISQLVSELAIGIGALEKLSDEAFTSANGRNGSIGAHFRHCIEVTRALLLGIRAGCVDYAARERNLLIESNRIRALEELRGLIMESEELRVLDIAVPLIVRSECVPGTNTTSSLGRELEYVISHTVHHHALIAERLRARGQEVAPMFGVAVSTKRHWEAAG